MNPERICYGCFEEKEPGIICPHCGFNENEETPYLALPLGTILNGRYLVGKVLGIGGFGITYLGYDLTLDIKVAIKEYMPSALATRHSDHYNIMLTGRVEQDYQYGMEKFLDEAKILAKLQNTPHVVSVQNYFKENGTAYFVMEYIDGMSLKAYLEHQGGKIPYTQAMTILVPIMEALTQIHALNLLHRDISPDNIYITSKGDSRLLDFGAARFALGDGKSVSVILKHGYAPEEQYSSHGNQGPWTDVYAMGATMYRCITGELPPDSVERVHGDTLKRPSELGVRIPAHVENAIIKALSIRTEDRFPNMESFIGALNGRVSVQDQVAASISQRTQATVYGQPTGVNPAASVKGESAFSRFLSFMKANPLIAGISGAGLVVILALCIILPIALSGNKNPSNGTGGSGTSTTISQTPFESAAPSSEPTVPSSEPTTPSAEPVPSSEPAPSTEPVPSSEPAPSSEPVEMITRDLGPLNATIQIPSNYEVDDSGLVFEDVNNDIMVAIDFLDTLEGPIYGLSDISAAQELIADQLMETEWVSEYQILTAGYDSMGAYDNAFQLCLRASDDTGSKVDMRAYFVESLNGFGCYCIIGAFNTGDEAAEAELLSIVNTFQINGAINTTYTMWYAENAGIKFIINDENSLGGVSEEHITEGYILLIFPTEAAFNIGLSDLKSPNAAVVEVEKAEIFGLYTPDAVMQHEEELMRIGGATAGGIYTVSTGGVEWTCQDFTYSNNDTVQSCASAMIDGTCYWVGCVFHSGNEETTTELYRQVLATVRDYNG